MHHKKQTDAHSFAPLEPTADGFRNYLRGTQRLSAEKLLVDRAQLLTLTAPEMTVLVGGLRVLGANAGISKHGVFIKRPQTLTNDFFVNLLDMSTQWQPSASSEGVYEGRARRTDELKWTGTRVDLIFGSHSQLRALAEVYACGDSNEKFVKAFAAWSHIHGYSDMARSGLIEQQALLGNDEGEVVRSESLARHADDAKGSRARCAIRR